MRQVCAQAAHKERRRRGTIATCAAAPSAPAGAAFSSSSIWSSCATAAAAVGGDLDMSLWTIGEKSAPSSCRLLAGSPPPLPAPPLLRAAGGSALRSLAIRARDGAGTFGKATHKGARGWPGRGAPQLCGGPQQSERRAAAQGQSSPRGRELAELEARGRRNEKRE